MGSAATEPLPGQFRVGSPICEVVAVAMLARTNAGSYTGVAYAGSVHQVGASRPPV